MTTQLRFTWEGEGTRGHCGRYLESGAVFSADRTYRYDLWRIWNRGGRRISFIGLNPSTADESSDDPTIRRCVRFAQSWGYDELHMLNLFAFVASNPHDLLHTPAPVGPENDTYLRALHSPVVVAWGSMCAVKERSDAVLSILPNPLCLGRNRDGQPKHPLYLPAYTKLERYSK